MLPYTLGQKIRMLREERGLSQQQLAGSDMTRAFVSLVEQDKCQPSHQTLSILSRRLEKPVEYFLDTSGDEEVEAIELLLMAAERAAERGDLPVALRNANGAVRLTQKLANAGLELRARRLVGTFYERTARYDEAYEQFEEVLDLCKQSQDRSGMAQAYYNLGRCALLGEDYGTARRQLGRCLRMTEGKKSQQDLRCRALINLSAAHHRMGNLQEALNGYERAWQVAQEYHFQQYQGYLAMNVGACHRLLGDLAQAEESLRLALAHLSEHADPLLPVCLNNLGLVLLNLRRLREGLELLEKALDLHRQRGKVAEQARTLNNIGHHWLLAGDLDRAEEYCEQALVLLDLQDELFVRGSVYRDLGRVYRIRGDQRRARELFRLSLEFFRRLKAVDEMMRTVAEMETEGEKVAPARQAAS